MKISVWSVFICLFLLGEVCAQNTIASLSFEGNKKSKEPYLLNFIQSTPGTVLDTALVIQDIKNILNTNLYAAVDARIDTLLEGLNLVFIVDEKIAAYPAGNGGIIDDNLWIELGWRNNNFLGRGIKAMLLAKYYDRFALRGFFKAPYWFKKGYGMESNWEFGRTIEPITVNPDSVLRYNQGRAMTDLLASYAIKPNNFVFAGFEYERLEYTYRDTEESTIPASLNEVQTKLLFVLRHHNKHHLNIFEQYVTGWANEFIVKSAIVQVDPKTNGGRWYPFMVNELKLFVKPWRSGNLGNRLRVGIAENNPTVFAQFIQDSFLNVRGLGNKPYRGTAELTNNIELRQTIYDRRWIALQSVVFLDYSTIRPPGREFHEMFTPEFTQLYAGLGGRIFFKDVFDFILRMDVGFSLTDNNHGFVLGLGHYF